MPKKRSKPKKKPRKGSGNLSGFDGLDYRRGNIRDLGPCTNGSFKSPLVLSSINFRRIAYVLDHQSLILST